MELSTDQRRAFNAYLEGKNVFITGPGGVGKTHLIREIYANAIKEDNTVQVCALTGCAAILLNCRARTIHAWSGVGLATGTNEANYTKAVKYGRAISWQTTDLLIIDEVSMMSLKLFNMLNFIAQKMRNNTSAFGGMQLIFSGDFFQLPPVPSAEPDTKKFCFESQDWHAMFNANCVGETIALTRNYRQNDNDFAGILNQIRIGALSDTAREVLDARVGIKCDNANIKPVKLFPRKHSVLRVNSLELRKIKEPIHTYTANIINNSNCSDAEATKEETYLNTHARFDPIVKLKKHAQVMCIVNHSATICNGSVGVITGFSADKYPIVKFNNGEELMMDKHIWESENIKEFGIAQVPLILAWAVTIHKSQGATLDLVEIDVGKGIFECGQTYVGLSRVRSLDGLFISTFAPDKIKVSSSVKAFYEKIENV